MSDYITLLDNATIASSPNTYLTVKYAYRRNGADMEYKIYCYAKLRYSSSYRNDGVSLTLALDGNTVLDSLKWKANNTNSWPLTYSNTFTVKNKISGSTSLYIRCWDSQGAISFDYKKTFTNLIVTDAFPILGLQSVNTEINKATINIANTITGNIDRYEVVKVSDGTIIKTGTVGSKSGNVELTNLGYNTNYSGIYKVRGYGNGGWGNYLTITSNSFVTKNLPIASSNNFDINSYPIFNLSSSYYLSNIKVDVYNGSSLLFTTEGVFTSRNLDSFANYKNSVLASQPNLSNIPITIKTKITSNSKDYYLSDIVVNAIVGNNDYNPIFNNNNITYEDTNEKSLNITGSKYKIIKGVSNVKYTITPMSTQGGAIGKSYTIKNGDQITSVDYSTENVVATINGVLNNSTNIFAIDSRNKSTLVNKLFNTFIEYTNPALISVSAIRNNGVDSNLLINLEGVFYVWSGLEKTNTIKHIYYRYRINDGTSSPSDLIEITNKTFPSAETFKVTNYITNGNYFDIDTKYMVEILVEDLLGLYVVSKINVPTAKPLIWKDKTNGFVGIGKKPMVMLDVSGKTILNDELELKGQLNLSNYNKIYWKEPGYGDKFTIEPRFSGADDDNYLAVRAAVGEAGTDPDTYNIATFSGKSGHFWVKGHVASSDSIQATKGFWSNGQRMPNFNGWCPDANDALYEGRYYCGGSSTNLPGSNPYGYLRVRVSNGDTINHTDNWGWQEFYNTNGRKWIRYIVNTGGWSPWKEIISEDYVKNQDTIWQGNLQMGANDTINLSKGISSQKTGIVLIFSGYSNGAAQNNNYTSYFIPRRFVGLYAGGGVVIPVGEAGRVNGAKYVYVYDDRLVGNANNTSDNNNKWVLTAIVGI